MLRTSLPKTNLIKSVPYIKPPVVSPRSEPKPFDLVHVPLQTSSLSAALASSLATTLVHGSEKAHFKFLGSTFSSSTSGGLHILPSASGALSSPPRDQVRFWGDCALWKDLSSLSRKHYAAASIHQGFNKCF